MRSTLPAVVLAALVASAGCNTDTPPVPTTPAPITTENFSGVVPVGGNDTHAFQVMLSNGLLTMTLTAAGPPSNVVMGVGLGQPDPTTGVCTLLPNSAVATSAGSTPQLSGSVNAGAYCTAVFDPGGLTAPVTYALVVTHY